MKIDFTSLITDLDDKPVLKPETDERLDLKHLAVTALSMSHEDEKGLAADEKVKRGILAEKIYSSSGDVDVSVEDVASIKKLIGKVYGAIVVMRAWALLDPGSVN